MLLLIDAFLFLWPVEENTGHGVKYYNFICEGGNPVFTHVTIDRCFSIHMAGGGNTGTA